MQAIFRCILSATLITLVSGTGIAQETETSTQHTDYGTTETRTVTKFGKGTLTETLQVKGGTAKLMTGPDAGYAFAALPGAKRITMRALARMKDIPKTGLYIVDADYVPTTLTQQLKREGYRLTDKGELTDRKGEPITLFVRPETFQLTPETIGPPSDFFKSPAPPSKTDEQQPYGKQGLFSPHPGIPQPGIWAKIKNLAKRVDLNPVSEAKAASPFPWSCYSWSWQWKYRGGFCRDYRAWTNAYAWGPGPGGSCNSPKPHTNIQYVRAYAKAAGDTDDEYCYNCDQEHAFADYDIGCFWPAHGNGSGYHFIHMVDGGLSVVRSAGWTH